MQHNRDPSNVLSGNLACVTAIMLFAFGFPAADRLLEDWGAIALIAARNSLGLLLLIALWTVIDGWHSVRNAPWLTGIRIGSFGFGFGATLLLVAQSLTNAVTASLAAATMPVAAVAIEVVLDGRKLNGKFIAGVTLVLAGGFLATGMSPGDARFGMGAVLGLIAATVFAWGSRSTVKSKSLSQIKPLGQTVVTTAGMTLFAVAVYLLFLMLGLPGTQSQALNYDGWVMMSIYAFVSLAISQAFWITGVGKLGIGVASFHLNAGPFYVMLILLLLGGDWNWLQACGAAILAAGVILAQRSQGARQIVSA